MLAWYRCVRACYNNLLKYKLELASLCLDKICQLILKLASTLLVFYSPSNCQEKNNSNMYFQNCFMIFMLSMYCTASMLPCGRYYYAPEGGYVGNPWVKFSYQYCYLYLGWIVHHLDLIEHHCFRYSRHIRNHSARIFRSTYKTGNPVDNKTTLMFGKKTSNAYSIKNINR